MSANPSLFARLRARLPQSSRGFVMFFTTSLAARGIGIVCQMLQVPLVVRSLGSEAFGLWVTMTSATSLILFADLGLGIGAQNRLAELFARDERTEARTVFGSAFVFLALLGIVLSGVALLVISHLNFATLFHLQDPATIAAAPSAAAAVALIFCLGFPFGLAQRLAFARQEGWNYNISQATGSLLSLGLVAYGAHRHWSLNSLVASAQGALLFGNIALLTIQLWQLKWLAFWKFALRLSALRSVVQVGACFGIQQILTTVLFSAPQLIISTTLGATVVTPYNLLQRIFNLFAVIQNAFMLPLWPAYSKAKARGEFEWMRHTLNRSIRATAFCSILPMAIGACFAPKLVEVWVGHRVEGITPLLIGLLCAWNSLAFLQQPFSFLLAGVSEIRRTTVYAIVSAVLSTILMFALAKPFGAPGVIVGLILGFLPFNFVGNIVESRRYLRHASDSAVTPLVPSPATAA